MYLSMLASDLERNTPTSFIQLRDNFQPINGGKLEVHQSVGIGNTATCSCKFKVVKQSSGRFEQAD